MNMWPQKYNLDQARGLPKESLCIDPKGNPFGVCGGVRVETLWRRRLGLSGGGAVVLRRRRRRSRRRRGRRLRRFFREIPLGRPRRRPVIRVGNEYSEAT